MKLGVLVLFVIALLLGSASSPRANTTVTAMWDANTEPDIDGYILYYGSQSGVYTTSVQVGNVTSYPLTLADGRYYFAVQARNTSGLVSPLSDEVVFDLSTAVPTITTQPVDQAVLSGQSATFAVVAIGALTFRWQVSTDGGGTWANVPNGGRYIGATTPTLTIVGATVDLNGTRYRSVASNAAGAATSNSARLVVTAPVGRENLAIGLGRYPGGGWLQTRRGVPDAFALAAWRGQLWSGYDLANGEYHLAAGDVDGDGLDEIVVGFGSGGAGWIAVLDDAQHDYALLKWIQVDWPSYNDANGSVFPAVGDINGDGRAEIVAGLGTGASGFYEVFDNAGGDYAALGWGQVAWSDYDALNGETHPAVGDVDGDGTAEIVLGLGTGGAGWMQVVNYTEDGIVPRAWLQVDWPAYDDANGATWPAAGDLDGDGRSEIVVGLGSGSMGYLEVLDDETNGFAPLRWIPLGWDSYGSANGETHPAVGSVDGDAAAEIVIGLGAYAGYGGWFEVLDDASHGFAPLGWQHVEWTSFEQAGGATFPAVGRFR
jgi:hypothetical protein